MSSLTPWRTQLRQPLQSPILINLERFLLRAISSKQTRSLLLWGGIATGVALLLIWNWQLVLATGLGMSAMWGTYIITGWNWRKRWSQVLQFFQSPQSRLTIAIGSGGLAAMGTYVAVSVWAHSANRWLAVSALLQGVATLLTLALLGWYGIGDRQYREEMRYERLLLQLTRVDPLQRLIVVRQLTRLSPKLTEGDRAQLLEYFRLLLSREEDEKVRNALLKGLGSCDRNLLQLEGKKPLKMPLHFPQSAESYHYLD
ncbi:MAG: ATP synthase subunit I [Cyanobacteria bacterium P01_E01_bin.42]